MIYSYKWIRTPLEAQVERTSKLHSNLLPAQPTHLRRTSNPSHLLVARKIAVLPPPRAIKTKIMVASTPLQVNISDVAASREEIATEVSAKIVAKTIGNSRGSTSAISISQQMTIKCPCRRLPQEEIAQPKLQHRTASFALRCNLSAKSACKTIYRSLTSRKRFGIRRLISNSNSRRTSS